MDWDYVQDRIRARVKSGIDLNTATSSYRKVESVDAIINSTRYGYHEKGLIVSIGQSNKIGIPWGMLKECFAQLDTTDGYNGAFFRKRFPLQAKDHPCHVHVVGQIFVLAGLARVDGRRYCLQREK